MKHTPLPWRVSGSVMERTATLGQKFINPLIECNETHEPLLAEIYGLDRPQEEKKANAAYIVQACNAFPDLLEALKELVLIEPHYATDKVRIEKARAIIAKAETP